jgi:hypothetical protein
MGEYSENRLLSGEQTWVGTSVKFNYGYEILDRRYYEYMPENGYVSVINPNIAIFEEKGPTYTVYDFINKLASGEPYRIGTRTYGAK